MGLYLCVFEEDEELDGVDAGAYSDFSFFRGVVTNQLEGGTPGAKYPTLILHSDCDGEWSVEECGALQEELESIAEAFAQLPPADFDSDWQCAVAKLLGLQPGNLYESLIDVDGEPLLERLLGLCRLAQDRGRPIIFQ